MKNTIYRGYEVRDDGYGGWRWDDEGGIARGPYASEEAAYDAIDQLKRVQATSTTPRSYK